MRNRLPLRSRKRLPFRSKKDASVIRRCLRVFVNTTSTDGNENSCKPYGTAMATY
jgi:hypothetical protein